MRLLPPVRHLQAHLLLQLLHVLLRQARHLLQLTTHLTQIKLATVGLEDAHAALEQRDRFAQCLHAPAVHIVDLALVGEADGLPVRALVSQLQRATARRRSRRFELAAPRHQLSPLLCRGDLAKLVAPLFLQECASPLTEGGAVVLRRLGALLDSRHSELADWPSRLAAGALCSRLLRERGAQLVSRLLHTQQR